VLIAGPSPPWPARGVRTAGTTPGSAKPTAGYSPGRALCPVRRPQGRLPRGRKWGLPLAVLAGGGRGQRRRGGPLKKGGTWTPTWGRTAAPRFVSEFPGLLPKGRVSACLCAAMRSAPGSRAGGAPCGGGGGSVGSTAAATAYGGAAGPGSRGVLGVEEEGPCPPRRGRHQVRAPAQVHRRALGGRGTIAWGRGRTGPSTTGTLPRTTPGRRPASGSPPATPWSSPRRGC